MTDTDGQRAGALILVVMVGLWVLLLITMRMGLDVPSPLASNGAAQEPVAQSAPQRSDAPRPTDEIGAGEYEVLQEVLTRYPELATVFEAVMVDGKVTYKEAENIFARKEALEAGAAKDARAQARERLLERIEALREESNQ